METSKRVLFQYSGIEAFDLLEYDGSLKVENLKKFGNFGLGCFNALDGELIFFDQQAYHATANGKLKLALPQSLVSCGYITTFDPIFQFRLKELEFSKLGNAISETYSHCGQPFYSVQLEGKFSKIQVRSVPPQTKPYPPISEIVKTQALFEYSAIEARMVGFYFPSYLQGITYPGFHLHFVTHDLQHGGHVLDFVSQEISLSISPIEAYHYILPDYTRMATKVPK